MILFDEKNLILRFHEANLDNKRLKISKDFYGRFLATFFIY